LARKGIRIPGTRSRIPVWGLFAVGVAGCGAYYLLRQQKPAVSSSAPIVGQSSVGTSVGPVPLADVTKTPSNLESPVFFQEGNPTKKPLATITPSTPDPVTHRVMAPTIMYPSH